MSGCCQPGESYEPVDTLRSGSHNLEEETACWRGKRRETVMRGRKVAEELALGDMEAWGRCGVECFLVRRGAEAGADN